MKHLLQRTWAEIDMDRLTNNFNYIRSIVPQGDLMPIMKADAYGHGANPIALLLQSYGVKWFAVSNIEEAIALRRAGVTASILILGYTPVSCASDLSKYNITQTLLDESYGKALSQQAVKDDVLLPVHIKVDTGMHRIGFPADEMSIAPMFSLPHIQVGGMFTHFSCADGTDDFDRQYSCDQWLKFSSVIAHLQKMGYDTGLCHCNNSAAILANGERSLDLVRPGIILYGCDPSSQVNDPHHLHAVLQLNSVVSMIKRVKKGDLIGYGATEAAPADSNIATIPIGYADGYPRALSNAKGSVLINGRRYPIIGRICMDQLMVNMGDDLANIGDRVVLIGESGSLSITAQDIARICNTIPYEILCNLSKRVPRVYMKTGHQMEIINNILSEE